jgi:hypothetical protein
MKTYLVWIIGISLILSTGLAGAASYTPGASLSVSANPTPSSARIRIVTPREDAIVPIGQNKVEISAVNIALDAAHPWHIYLDGTLLGTIANGDSTFTMPISVSGPHEIKVTLSDTENNVLASASVQVTAAPATPTSSPFNLPWVAPTMAVLLIGVAALIVISLRVTRRRIQA